MTLPDPGTPAAPKQTTVPRRDWRVWLVIALLIACAVAPRLAAPWRWEVSNDELHHLESWRNQYRTGDVFGYFMRRLDGASYVPPRALALAHRVYGWGEPFQRAFIVLVDPQPPLFPVTAEIVEATTHSSLVALRLVSAIASVAFVAMLWRFGRELTGSAPAAGIVTAVGSAVQFHLMYAGIGRPYALAQSLLIGALLTFALFARGRRSLAAFLGIAAVAQATSWMAWPVLGPLVLVAARDAAREPGGWRRIRRAAYWYVPLSLALLVYMVAQLKNPTITNQAGARGVATWFLSLSFNLPLLFQTRLPAAYATAGAVLCLAVAAFGAAKLWREPAAAPSLRLGLVLAAAGGLLAMVFLGSSPRFAVTYTLPTLLLIGYGLWRACAGRQTAAALLAAAVTIGFGAETLTLWRHLPEIGVDGPYSPIARDLKTSIRPGDAWTATPYFLANCLYRYGPLPAPYLPTGGPDAEQYIARTRGRDLYVLAANDEVESVRALRPGEVLGRYNPGPLGVTLLRFPADAPTTRP